MAVRRRCETTWPGAVGSGAVVALLEVDDASSPRPAPMSRTSSRPAHTVTTIVTSARASSSASLVLSTSVALLSARVSRTHSSSATLASSAASGLSATNRQSRMSAARSRAYTPRASATRICCPPERLPPAPLRWYCPSLQGGAGRRPSRTRRWRSGTQPRRTSARRRCCHEPSRGRGRVAARSKP